MERWKSPCFVTFVLWNFDTFCKASSIATWSAVEKIKSILTTAGDMKDSSLGLLREDLKLIQE